MARHKKWQDKKNYKTLKMVRHKNGKTQKITRQTNFKTNLERKNFLLQKMVVTKNAQHILNINIYFVAKKKNNS